MADMVSIGEIAQRTGVSRRMLRHWEQLGLVRPASTDAATGYRRYAPSQVGRVRAVASLRTLGFGLDAIGDLLDAGLTEQRLVELLRTHEQELAASIDEATHRLAAVRSRLATFETGRSTIVNTLDLTPLPDLRLWGLRASVRDETEIPEAAGRLSGELRARLDDPDDAVVLLYDGSADDEIQVTAATATAGDGLVAVDVAAVGEGVTVTFAERPDVADAWVALDAALADRGLRTVGVHRHTTAPDGTVTLQAGVRTLD